MKKIFTALSITLIIVSVLFGWIYLAFYNPLVLGIPIAIIFAVSIFKIVLHEIE